MVEINSNLIKNIIKLYYDLLITNLFKIANKIIQLKIMMNKLQREKV